MAISELRSNARDNSMRTMLRMKFNSFTLSIARILDFYIFAAEPQRGSTLFLTCSLDPVFCAELCIVEKSIRVGWMLDVHFPGEKVEFQVIF